MPRVLYVSHNHPSNRSGGAEVYAEELYRAARDADGLDPLLVAKNGPPFSEDAPPQGTRFSMIGADPHAYFVYTDAPEFSRLFGTMSEKRLFTEDWPAFLRAHQPDVIHFQHTLFLGYDLLRASRAALPEVPIVYTLHEFLPICHHNGQMVLRGSLELCDRASPRRCHGCFPEVAAQSFFLRERFIKAAFELVDVFITPSAHARRRYIEWGIAPEKVVHENYGRVAVAALADPPDAGQRRRIAFFGQITQFKGVDVLLEAMKLLARREVPVTLSIHGANLEHQRPAFRERIESLLQETAGSVRFAGRYSQAQLPGLMSAADWVVVPSIWWETGPLVIHEALMHHRPVICSDIGSMLERVQDGVNGLHFRAADPGSLADTIQRAVTEPGLWPALRGAITDPYPMSEHLPKLTALYDQLLQHRRTPHPISGPIPR